MATVREGVMKLHEPDSSLSAEIISEPCDLPKEDFPTEVIEVIKQAQTVNLKAAPIIIGAGMGACDPDTFELVKSLATALNAEIAASRPVVDMGVVEKERQIGQTGVTVRPNLYIAVGISGQIQHSAGISDAKRIIAINTDPDAPIFQIAHYGIVGDARKVIPQMIQAYQEK